MSSPLFILKSPFAIAGDQNNAIKKLCQHRPGRSLLMGVTGSGKTFTMANIIAQQNKQVLVLAPNKTLAAQLYEEFSLFFPHNKVCYFVSYYDYYQPESYLPAQDVYIPKETKVNSELDRLRIEATASLVTRKDTIIVASVSSIYSLGNPNDYRELAMPIKIGEFTTRDAIIKKLVSMQYQRNELSRDPGTFQVMGNTIEIQLPYQKEKLRIEFFSTTIDTLCWVDRHNNTVLMNLDSMIVFPAKHFVTPEDRKKSALESIEKELYAWLPRVTNPLYKERIEKRVLHDLEMLEQVGYVSGIENYSSHFDGRSKGERPYCLLDFFDHDFLLIIDESHIAIPQLHGMYAGDRARKKALIDFGFRLPSAYENRPLKFEEIEQFFRDVIFVSATPGEYEMTHSDTIVEQIIRPTGLLDPLITVHPRKEQLTHLVNEIKKNITMGYRSLVMVLTKKLAEELARHLEDEYLIKVCYLHSDLKTPQRTALLHKLRAGIFDCLVGVNLLREGIDLPEVAFVAIMDADIESFLRDKRSLIQIIGRAARNTHAHVVLYADTITGSMKAAIDETKRRRTIQEQYNKEHHIIPESVKREVTKTISPMQQAIEKASKSNKKHTQEATQQATITPEERMKRLADLEEAMQAAGDALDFEKAIQLREEWFLLQKNTPKD